MNNGNNNKSHIGLDDLGKSKVAKGAGIASFASSTVMMLVSINVLPRDNPHLLIWFTSVLAITLNMLIKVFSKYGVSIPINGNNGGPK